MHLPTDPGGSDQDGEGEQNNRSSNPLHPRKANTALPERLPSVVRDPGSQRNFDALNEETNSLSADLGAVEERFPVAAKNLATSAKELFLQLVTPAARKVNFGTTKLKWSASQQSNTVEIEHGLGTTPVLVLSQLRSFQLTNITIYTTSRSATKLALFGFSAVVLSTEMELDWEAKG